MTVAECRLHLLSLADSVQRGEHDFVWTVFDAIGLLLLQGYALFFSSKRRHTSFKCDWSSDVCFFFSSRRRHTRFKCDWSSDVCSSDLSRITTTLRSLTRTPTTLTTCTDVSSTVTESG